MSEWTPDLTPDLDSVSITPAWTPALTPEPAFPAFQPAMSENPTPAPAPAAGPSNRSWEKSQITLDQYSFNRIQRQTLMLDPAYIRDPPLYLDLSLDPGFNGMTISNPSTALPMVPMTPWLTILSPTLALDTSATPRHRGKSAETLAIEEAQKIRPK